MTPEEKARLQIDRKLELSGWVIQEKKRLNLYESLGVAVREMDTDTGPADYMLFVDGKTCGILESRGPALLRTPVAARRYTSG